MAKVTGRYRQLEAESDHLEKFFPHYIGYLFVLAAALIVQVATPRDGHIVTLCCFLVALGSWTQLLRSAFKRHIQARWTGLVMALILIVCVLFSPATSKDVNSYSLYGRISAEYHVSPYTHVPRDFAADPWFSRTSAYWSDTPSVYGPAFTAISARVMDFAGTSYLRARLGFQLIAALSLVAATVLLSRRLGWGLAIVGVGLNPLLLTFGVNDAHCDVLIGTAVLTGVLAIERRWYVVAGCALGLAALIKVSLLPALFGAFVWLWFQVSKRSAIKTVAAGSLVVGLGLVLSGGLSALTPLHRASLRHTRFSVWNPVHIVLTDVFGSGAPTHTTADSLISLLASIAVAVVGLGLLWRNRCGAKPAVAVVSIVLAYQILGAYTLSWYAAWSLPTLGLLLAAGRLRNMKAFAVVMAQGCWLAIAYLSGYAAIVVSVVGIAYLLACYLRRSEPTAVAS